MNKKVVRILKRKSYRLKGYDYGKNGAYFITFCTKNRVRYFGEIVNQEMILNELGKIAHQLWQEIPNQFPYTRLENFVVMPDHIHGIIVINKDSSWVAINRDPTEEPPSNINGGITGIHNPMFHESISRIIRWFKGRSRFEIKKIEPEFYWQRLFYDHIIRNEKSFQNIQRYIENNPKAWKGKKIKNF